MASSGGVWDNGLGAESGAPVPTWLLALGEGPFSCQPQPPYLSNSGGGGSHQSPPVCGSRLNVLTQHYTRPHLLVCSAIALPRFHLAKLGQTHRHWETCLPCPLQHTAIFLPSESHRPGAWAHTLPCATAPVCVSAHVCSSPLGEELTRNGPSYFPSPSLQSP